MPETSSGQEAPKEVEIPEELKKKVKIFDDIDAVYRSQPKFKDIFDRAMKGDYSFVAEDKKEEKKEVESDPLSKFEHKLQEIAEENKKLKEEVTGVRNAYGWDKVAGSRQETNIKYEQALAEMAEQKGYEYGSPAYQSLFDSAVKESGILAKKYGLVNESGIIDPLVKYSPEMVKEAFQRAYDKHKQMGYDIDEVKRKEAVKKAQEEREQAAKKFDDYLKVENIKTRDKRASTIERFFNTRARELGIDLKEIKVV